MASAATNQQFPKPALYFGLTLICVTLVCTLIGRFTDFGTLHLPRAEARESRALHFADAADGSVVITQSPDGSLVTVLAPGTNGFIRGLVRGLARDRKLRQLGPEQPFLLTRRTDGRLVISDPQTGREVELGAFGPTNYEAFAQLMHAGEKTK